MEGYLALSLTAQQANICKYLALHPQPDHGHQVPPVNVLTFSVTATRNVWNDFVSIFTDTIPDAVISGWNAISSFFTEIWNVLSTSITEFFSELISEIGEALKNFGRLVKGLFEKGIEWFKRLWDKLTGNAKIKAAFVAYKAVTKLQQQLMNIIDKEREKKGLPPIPWTTKTPQEVQEILNKEVGEIPDDDSLPDLDELDLEPVSKKAN